MKLFDQFDRPMAGTTSDYYGDQIRGGWVQTTNPGQAFSTASSLTGQHAPNRMLERAAARTAFMLNPLLSGAVDVIHGFVLGRGLSYGEFHDKDAQLALEEFWSINDFEELANRWLDEYLVDGENLTLFPTDRVGQNMPARIGFYDVATGFELEHEKGLPNHVTSVLTQANRLYEEGQFHWSAHRAYWNEVRGWPVIMQAVPAALAYVNFVNARIRLHKLQSRINALYKAFIRSTDPKAALQEQKDKASAFARVPEDGAVMTIGKDPGSGQAEEFELLSTNANARDSSADGRLIRLLVAVALNLPEHWLGEGGDVTRTTADSMSSPAKNSLEVRQQRVARWATSVFRLELKRRYGPEKKYRVRKARFRDGIRVVDNAEVPADLLEPPWLFPEVDEENLEGIIQKVKLASEKRYASAQTLAGILGFDYAQELENMGTESDDTGGGDPENDSRPRTSEEEGTDE